MANKNKVPDFLKMAKELKENASRYAASEAVKFFRESFVKQAWDDGSLHPWTKSNSPMAGKRTLYRSGKLMRSIKKESATTEQVVTIADSDYAEIHNNGGYITVTENMKRFFWAKHMQFKKSNKRKAEFFKAMAKKEVGSKMKIPQHQFIGESQTLMGMLDTFFIGQTKIVFKQYLNNK